MGTDCLQSHERDPSEQEELQSEELQPEELQPGVPQLEELQSEEPQPKVPHSDAAPGYAPAFALHVIWVIVPMRQ